MNREIIIGFSRPYGWFKFISWAIRLSERLAPFSHVYVKTWSSAAESWVIYQASGTQVNFIGENFFLAKAYVYREFKFIVSEESFKSYMQFAIRNAGAPYGMKPVLGIAVMRLFKMKKNPWADGDKSFFCAELAAKALRDFVEVSTVARDFETAGPSEIFEICKKLGGK